MTRLRRLRFPVLILCAGLAWSVAETQQDEKFIELGWDIPSTTQLREHWQEMEQTTPFDGVMFRVEVQDGQGTRLSSQSIWDAKPWQREWLKPAPQDLQACHFERFKDNFVRFNATLGNLAWDDNADWATQVAKAGHCAYRRQWRVWSCCSASGRKLPTKTPVGSTISGCIGCPRQLDV